MLPEKPIGKNEKGEDVYVDEEMVDRLIDPKRVEPIQREAEKKARRLSKEEFHRLRVACKRDLFFLCTGILGYTRLTEAFHGPMCNWITNTEREQFRELLIFRGGFKTRIKTISHNIQTALPYTKDDAAYDDNKDPLPYPLDLGTDVKILIAHETHESAARFLYSITDHFTSNPLLISLFPECVPSRKNQRINKHELELPRSKVGTSEPTFDTLGVGGKSQGRHYNEITLDDIFGDKARDSEAEAATTIQWFDNIQSFFTDFARDRFTLVGTRYNNDDVYAHAHEVYGNKLVKYIRKIEEINPRTGQKEITFPEGFPLSSLEIIRKNKKVFNAQYLNDPEDLGKGFNPEWKKIFYWTSQTTLAIFSGDGRDRTYISIRDLDIVIIIDPGLGKSGGFVVTGMDYTGRVFILFSMRLELTHPQLVDLLFKSVVKWQPRIVAFEADFFASIYEPWLKREQQVRGIRFKIEPVFTKKVQKDLRIDGLSNYFEGGVIFLNEAQEELMEEFRQYGKTKNIHILDALAYGPEVWRKPMSPEMRALMNSSSSENDSEDSEDETRDAMTGYSAQ
jgi:hypothetical protein